MQINLTGHHVDITEAMRNYVDSRFERLSRHLDHVLDAHVVLSVESCGTAPRPPFRSTAATSMPKRPRMTCTPPSTP